MDSGTSLWATIALCLLGLALLYVITPTPAELAEWQTQEIAADKKIIFQATMEYLQDQGYTLKNADSEVGLIKTDYASLTRLKGPAGTIEEILTGKHRSSVTITIRSISTTSCKVRVNLIAERWNPGPFGLGGHWSRDPYQYTKESYQEFFRGLRKEIEEMQKQ